MALMLISAPPLTGYDVAQIISSLNTWALLSVKEVNSNQLIGRLGGLTEKTCTECKNSAQSLSAVIASYRKPKENEAATKRGSGRLEVVSGWENQGKTPSEGTRVRWGL